MESGVALIRDDKVAGEGGASFSSLGREACAGCRRREGGTPWLKAVAIRRGTQDPGSGDGAPASLGMPSLRSRAEGTPATGPGAPGLNSSGRRFPEAGLGLRWSHRASGGAGVQDSRINVLKATTPSSPCRKMPKLCMSAPLSQRPAPDATVEGGPPGSLWLAFPAGPCMAGLAEGRGAPRPARPPGLAACGGRAAELRAGSPSREPVPPPRGPLAAARNPTSETAAPDWLGRAWGRASAAPALPRPPTGGAPAGRGGGVVRPGHR